MMGIPKPFTKYFALFLVFIMLRSSLCSAAALSPGSLALLDGAFSGPEMRAVWELASRNTYLDPHLLVMGEEDVALILDRWRDEGDAVQTAWRTADSAALQQIRGLIDEAWSAYYAFSFEKALGLLGEADKFLDAPGDSRFRSRMTFEAGVLKGMILRAVGDRAFAEEFTKAAAVDPDAELPPDRYSPEIISAYSRVKMSLLEKEPVFLTIEGTPGDAKVLVDGKAAGTARETLAGVPAGRHFIEASAPGYETFSRVLEIEEWESPSVNFSLLETGPEGEPAPFFLQRLEVGDRSYLSRLAGVLDVDYVLIPDGEEGILRTWLVDREGRTVAHGIIWSPGEEQAVAVERISAILEPLQLEWGDPGGSAFFQMNLPPVSDSIQGDWEEIEEVSVWKRYAPVIGLLILVGVAAVSGSESGGTRIEVTW